MEAAEKIIIVDFGGQYTHLIARRVRELGVYAEIKPPETPIAALKKACGVILSGGPATVFAKGAPTIPKEIFHLGTPLLGLCYGHQLMAHILGGRVISSHTREYGPATMRVRKKKDIFKGLLDEEYIWMSHGVEVKEPPKGFEIIGSTGECRVAAMADFSNNIYGLQFHPEVTHTKHGMMILENFITLCGCPRDWSMDAYFASVMETLKQKIRQRKVLLLISGGVDSTVCFALLNKSIGENNVYGLHIDNGLLRKNESASVDKAFRDLGFSNYHVYDASSDFLRALKNVSDPEKKRNIIGNKFIEVQRRAIKDLDLDPDKWMLGQGTIYPDTIESCGTEHADLIKTHHNRVEVVQKLIDQGLVVEPLKDLYKDEVRELGKRIGLPEKVLKRHPFPGPGLSIRCICSTGTKATPQQPELVKKIAANVGYEAEVLPLWSVGVQGDERSYSHPVLLFGRLDWNKLDLAATKITNSVSLVNRVLYYLHPAAPKKLILTKAYITKARLDLLRELDYVVHSILKNLGIYDKIWQFPVILAPIGFKHFESVVLRPVFSAEAMTANFYRMDPIVVGEIRNALSKYPVDCIFYDVTNKPPGTIEWE